MPTLTSLAEEAVTHAKQLDHFLATQGRPITSFKEDTLFDLPPLLMTARDNLINTTQLLSRLALGPTGVLLEIMWSCVDQVSLDVVNSFSFAHHVPKDGTISIEDLARKVKLPAHTTERFIRHAMSNRIFTEQGTGQVAHTASSRMLATNPELSDTISMMAKEIWPLGVKMTEAVKLNPQCSEPTETSFSLLYEPGVTMWELLGSDPEREARFQSAMSWFSTFDSWSLKHLINGYPWEEVDVPGARLVDVGGGQGSVAVALAESTKDIKFIVQDFGAIIEKGKKALPSHLEDRVSFMEHDFFSDQVVDDADVYFFRWVLHEWTDKYAVRILKSLVPAMKRGARIVVFEFLLADGPETRKTEKQPRSTDLVMMGQFNGRERTEKGFKQIFQQADERFVLKDVMRPRGSALSIIEVVWEGSE